jgi:hypothetical protein
MREDAMQGGRWDKTRTFETKGAHWWSEGATKM